MFSEFKHWNTPGQNPRILADPSKSAINLFPYQIAHAKITDETIKVWLKVRSSKVVDLSWTLWSFKCISYSCKQKHVRWAGKIKAVQMS